MIIDEYLESTKYSSEQAYQTQSIKWAKIIK